MQLFLDIKIAETNAGCKLNIFDVKRKFLTVSMFFLYPIIDKT